MPEWLLPWVTPGSMLAGAGVAWVLYRPGRVLGPLRRALAIRPHRPAKRLSAVEDMLQTKTRIRQEERQRWSERFEELAGEPWHAAGERKARLEAAYADARRQRDARERALAAARAEEVRLAAGTGWDGKHHATCPYECDCPPAVRNLRGTITVRADRYWTG